jgi:hypothetical protein
MKPNPEMLFGNIFNDERITPKYLERFSDDHLAKLTKNNTGTTYTSLINAVTNALTPFKAELGDVDTSLNTLEGKTLTVDTFITGFVSYMKDNYINIAAKLGGDNTAAFIEFYPKGKTEYNRVTKTQMPTIMTRLNTAATSNATALGTTITAQLQAFQTQWTSLRKTQLEGKASLKTNRQERSSTRINLELALLGSIHFIAQKFPGDVEKAMVFFNFSLLFGVHRTGADEPTPSIETTK